MSENSNATTEQISIIPGRCIGAGNCVEVADSYFDQNDDDATVVLLRDDVPAEDQDTVRRAINVCPVAALALTNSARA
jgi:ferredoxin